KRIFRNCFPSPRDKATWNLGGTVVSQKRRTLFNIELIGDMVIEMPVPFSLRIFRKRTNAAICGNNVRCEPRRAIRQENDSESQSSISVYFVLGRVIV